MADIAKCKGIDCKMRMTCYRFTAISSLRQFYMDQPYMTEKDRDCDYYYYNINKPSRFIKEKKRKLPWKE